MRIIKRQQITSEGSYFNMIVIATAFVLSNVKLRNKTKLKT